MLGVRGEDRFWSGAAEPWLGVTWSPVGGLPLNLNLCTFPSSCITFSQ